MQMSTDLDKLTHFKFTHQFLHLSVLKKADTIPYLKITCLAFVIFENHLVGHRFCLGRFFIFQDFENYFFTVHVELGMLGAFSKPSTRVPSMNLMVIL